MPRLLALAIFAAPFVTLALAFPTLERWWNQDYARGLSRRYREDADDVEAYLRAHPRAPKETQRRWLRSVENSRAQAVALERHYRIHRPGEDGDDYWGRS